MATGRVPALSGMNVRINSGRSPAATISPFGGSMPLGNGRPGPSAKYAHKASICLSPSPS